MYYEMDIELHINDGSVLPLRNPSLAMLAHNKTQRFHLFSWGSIKDEKIILKAKHFS